MLERSYLPIPLLLFLMVLSCDATQKPISSAANSLSSSSATINPPNAGASLVDSAYANQLSGLQVLVTGTIVRVLVDDVSGDKHQRFIISHGANHTILIAHNIDLAPRVPNLVIGTDVEVFGEYEWNGEGGVIHWTHHDPAGQHVDGWIQYNGVKYYKN